MIRDMTPCKEEGEEGELEEDLSRMSPTLAGISLFTPCSIWQGWSCKPQYLVRLLPITSFYTGDLISQAAGPAEDQAGSLGSLKVPSLLLGKLFSSFTRAVCLLQISGERGRAS